MQTEVFFYNFIESLEYNFKLSMQSNTDPVPAPAILCRLEQWCISSVECDDYDVKLNMFTAFKVVNGLFNARFKENLIKE